ncbi:molybdopterin-guanine dinucleotide biosynthesis protein B [Thauera phenylacetica]|jgi:molybdopterin-guanine dinucleotide biosynthesis protein B|uniref:Molybdopterin-guanine dinucleotide biosynthesis protein B n=1 Tax=Thauera phenylacetica B4P TaxID=1234382 RepID=N6YM87_9RHOO|nr:molybdopterin-guanine dinucleotide biosynthesis protein B [Thauera phenylacetica]ENO92620.1 molybdopterin-guanine dinucleotide biosynthesis protein B [Thauera phenylacetica B4P]HRM70657.1 molybdopterin-guanine dinucleotide biosynthesis protein B [Thauera phenylacetica]
MNVMGFAGWSGSGKTTLVEQVIAALSARGLVVSLVKHAHHSFDIDHAGKDSWRHRQAGCREVMVSSDQRWSLTRELRGAPEAGLDELLAHLGPCDLVLVEGFKRAAIPKIEVWRSVVAEPLLHPDDPRIVALATDARVESALPQLDINDPEGVADFIVEHLGLRTDSRSAP